MDELKLILAQASIYATKIGNEKLIIALGFSILFMIVFIGMFLSGQPERTMGQKIFDLIAMVFYTGMFAGFIVGGMFVGGMLGSVPAGFCVGVILFGVIFQAYGYAKMKRQPKLYYRR